MPRRVAEQPARGEASVEAPAFAYVGETRDATVTVTLRGGRLPGAVAVAVAAGPIVALEDDGRLWVALEAGSGAALLPLVLVRRGMARLDRLWLRWRGPLGLAWRQRQVALDLAFPVLPDVRPVHERGARIFQRHALQGLIAQIEPRRWLRFRCSGRVPLGHGPARDRLEAIGAAHEAPRQGISHRAQQPDRLRRRFRAADVASRSRACRASTAPSRPCCSPPGSR